MSINSELELVDDIEEEEILDEELETSEEIKQLIVRIYKGDLFTLVRSLKAKRNFDFNLIQERVTEFITLTIKHAIIISEMRSRRIDNRKMFVLKNSDLDFGIKAAIKELSTIYRLVPTNPKGVVFNEFVNTRQC